MGLILTGHPRKVGVGPDGYKGDPPAGHHLGSREAQWLPEVHPGPWKFREAHGVHHWSKISKSRSDVHIKYKNT